MIFNRHSNLEGAHAFLSPSKYSWLNYDEAELMAAYQRYLSVQRGTELHDLAKKLIKLGVKLPKKKETLNLYVNDAIGYRMTPEQPLFYSPYSFGTADTISFRKNTLRIHDLKTGQTPTKMQQLEIYASLFCLEYQVKPSDIQMELRIYQNNEVLIHEPESSVISEMMEKIKSFDEKIQSMTMEG